MEGVLIVSPVRCVGDAGRAAMRAVFDHQEARRWRCCSHGPITGLLLQLLKPRRRRASSGRQSDDFEKDGVAETMWNWHADLFEDGRGCRGEPLMGRCAGSGGIAVHADGMDVEVERFQSWAAEETVVSLLKMYMSQSERGSN